MIVEQAITHKGCSADWRRRTSEIQSSHMMYLYIQLKGNPFPNLSGQFTSLYWGPFYNELLQKNLHCKKLPSKMCVNNYATHTLHASFSSLMHERKKKRASLIRFLSIINHLWFRICLLSVFTKDLMLWSIL